MNRAELQHELDLEHEAGVTGYGSHAVHYCDVQDGTARHRALCGAGSICQHVARLGRGNYVCAACQRAKRQPAVP